MIPIPSNVSNKQSKVYKIQRGRSSSHKETARTKHAEAATTRAAKMGGTMRSMLEAAKRWAGKQRISAGMSSGSLSERSGYLHGDEECGEIAETKAASGEKDATATATVRTAVHPAAYAINGHRHDTNDTTSINAMFVWRRKPNPP